LRRILIIGWLLLCVPALLVAQDKSTLEKKRKKLESEINQTQKAIKQTQTTRDNSLNEIITLEKQITLRKELITNTQNEVKEFSQQIQETNRSLGVLEQNLKILRENYAKAIYGTYKSFRLADQLMFLASSNSFSEALRKLNYLRKVGDYRKAQVAEILHTQDEINKKLNFIQEKKTSQERLLSQQKKQELALTRNKVQKAKLVEQLKRKETSLVKQLADKKKEAEKLNSQIQAIIAKEIERQRKLEEQEAIKKANENKSTGGSGSKPVISATPEVAKLSASFAANRGKLPWPVERGSISRGYGPYRHPVFGTDMDNKGIDIRTEPNASVRAVFDGKVISIVSNPIYKNAVIVSHGDYFTVYTKLESVNVQKGQSISAKQTIGRVYTDNESNETELHFEVWQGNAIMNPALWIAR